MSFCPLFVGRYNRTARISRNPPITGEELLMYQGIRTVVYPVKNNAKARVLFRELLGVVDLPQ
jgi:hypothetical protein